MSLTKPKMPLITAEIPSKIAAKVTVFVFEFKIRFNILIVYSNISSINEKYP
jgi:hypothetical protein